jgi:hypothetical protein
MCSISVTMQFLQGSTLRIFIERFPVNNRLAIMSSSSSTLSYFPLAVLCSSAALSTMYPCSMYFITWFPCLCPVFCSVPDSPVLLFYSYSHRWAVHYLKCCIQLLTKLKRLINTKLFLNKKKNLRSYKLRSRQLTTSMDNALGVSKSYCFQKI